MDQRVLLRIRTNYELSPVKAISLNKNFELNKLTENNELLEYLVISCY